MVANDDNADDDNKDNDDDNAQHTDWWWPTPTQHFRNDRIAASAKLSCFSPTAKKEHFWEIFANPNSLHWGKVIA